MGWLSVDLVCDGCGHRWDSLIDREDARDRSDYECPSCAAAAGYRTVSAPALMQRSFPDGTKRPGFDKLRRENTLQTELSETRKDSDKQQIHRELSKLASTKT